MTFIKNPFPGNRYKKPGFDLGQLIHSDKFNLFGERPTISGIFLLAGHDLVRLHGDIPEK
jgi:hypothetical protein